MLGRQKAAVALAIVSAKEAAYFRTSPGGYFHGMVATAEGGELNLAGPSGRTLWALRNGANANRADTQWGRGAKAGSDARPASRS